MSEEPTQPDTDEPKFAITVRVGYDGNATYESGIPAGQTIDVLQRLIYSLYTQEFLRQTAAGADIADPPDRDIEDTAVDAELV